jgi:hypothetical protein
MLTTTAEVVCPHCWESVTLSLDLSVEQQTYIEDCEVCCRPMQVLVVAAPGELIEVRVEAAS